MRQPKTPLRKLGRIIRLSSKDHGINLFYVVSLFTITWGILTLSCTDRQKTEDISSLKELALNELTDVLKTQSRWVKVHAAEFLLWAGYPTGVKEIYQEEERKYENEPQYRIGIWRVLAQAAITADEKNVYIEKIREAFMDTSGSDRIHAAETMAKLRYAPPIQDSLVTKATLLSPVKPLAWYTQWSVAYTSDDAFISARSRLLTLIQEDDGTGRLIGAFALSNLGGLSDDQWDILYKQSIDEPDTSIAKIYLLSASFTTSPDLESKRNKVDNLYQMLRSFSTSSKKSDRMVMAMAFAEKGSIEDLPLLESLLRNEHPLENEAEAADVRAAAAYAILKIIQRQS